MKLLKQFEQLLERLFQGALAYPRLVLSVSALLFFAAIVQIPKLESLVSIEDMLDESYSSFADIRDITRKFKIGHTLFVVLEPTAAEGFSQEDLCAIDRWFNHELSTNKSLIRATSPLQVRRSQYDGKTIQYPLVIPNPCTSKMSRVSALLETPWVHFVTDISGRDLLLEFEFQRIPFSTRYGSFDPEHIAALVGGLDHALEVEHVRGKVHLGGPAAFEWHMARGLDHDQIINLLALICMVVAYRIFFGSWRGGFVLAGTLVYCGVLLMGAMAVAGVRIDILCNSLFLMIMVASVQDFLYLAYARRRGNVELFSVYRSYITPSFFTSFTTMVGFGTLYFSQIHSIARFGVWAAVGAGLEWVTVFFITPSLMKLVPRLQIWARQERSHFVKTFDHIAAKKPHRVVTIFLLLVMIGGVSGITRIVVNDTPRDGFPEAHRLRKDMAYISQSRGWESDFTLVFQPPFSGDRRKIIAALESDPETVAVYSGPGLESYLTRGQPPLTQDAILRDFRYTPAYDRFYADDGTEVALILVREASVAGTRKLMAKIHDLCPARECYLTGGMVVYQEFSDRVIPSLIDSFVWSLLLVTIILLGLAYSKGLTGEALPILISSFWGVFFMVGVYTYGNIAVNHVTCIFASVLIGMAGDNAIQYMFASRDRNLDIGIKAAGVGSILVTVMICSFSLLFCLSEFKNPRILGMLFCGGFVCC